MSQPPPPGMLSFPYDAPSPVAPRPRWIEPARRTPWTGSGSYDGRYGAALATTLLGGYLVATNSSLAQLLQAIGYGAGASPELVLYSAGLSVFAIAALLAGVVLAPATVTRRVVAVGVMAVLALVFTVLTTMRAGGDLAPEPWTLVVLHPAFLATLAGLTGWLIVRARPVVAYLMLVPTVVVGIVPLLLTSAISGSALGSMVAIPLALLTGSGGAWAARWMAMRLQR